MATTLTLNSLVSFYGTYGSDADIEEAVASIFPQFFQAYSNGTGSTQANTWWADTISLTTSPTSLDLTGGLTDRWGNTLTFSSVREVFVANNSTTLKAYYEGSRTGDHDYMGRLSKRRLLFSDAARLCWFDLWIPNYWWK